MFEFSLVESQTKIDDNTYKIVRCSKVKCQFFFYRIPSRKMIESLKDDTQHTIYMYSYLYIHIVIVIYLWYVGILPF